MNLYAAEKYTARRQTEDRESARAWNSARELQRQPQDRIGALVPDPLGPRHQLVGGCASGHSPTGSWPTIQ